MSDRGHLNAPMGYALVGCGNIGGRHARCLAQLPGARIVAAVDRDAERASRLAGEIGAEAFCDVDAAAHHPGVGAALVSVPSPRHVDVAQIFAKLGKHILVEKPIAMHPEHADALISCCREHGVTVSVVSQHRFHDDVQWLKGLLDRGALGKPITAEAMSLWRRDQAYYDAAPGRGRHDAAEGGVLLNQAVHVLDLLLWLLGPARRVHATHATLTHQIAVEDTAVMCVELVSGALAVVSASTSVHTQTGERIGVRCERGTVVIQGGRAVELDLDPSIPPPPSRSRPAGESDPLEPFRRQHHDFLAAIRAGRPPCVRAAEARAVVDLIVAAYRAAERGAAVDLPYVSPA